MNYDSIYISIRYSLIAAGSIAIGVGWANADTWAELMRGFDLLGGALVVLVPAAWGLWVNWNTKKVPAQVVEKRNLPTVSGATGMIQPPK